MSSGPQPHPDNSADMPGKTYPRIGTTSFIVYADILTNVTGLAPFMDDVELVLFSTDGNDNLPSPAVLADIRKIAGKSNLTFTVHLPLALQFGDTNAGKREQSIDMAVHIITLMQPVTPFAYILHLNAGHTGEPDGSPDEKKAWSRWTDSCCRSLKKLSAETVPISAETVSISAETVSISAGTVPEHCICIENLESFDIDRLSPVLENTGVSLCLDIGHLWLQGKDPVRCIDRYSKRIRVVHLHGIDQRDHSSLVHADPGELQRVLDALTAHHFSGVLTLEIFSYKDLFTSLDVLDSLGFFKSHYFLSSSVIQQFYTLFESREAGSVTMPGHQDHEKGGV